MAQLTPTERAILTSPTRMPGARWGSRDVAAATGTSQSMVARVWARHLAGTLLPEVPAAIAITDVWVGGGDCVITATVLDDAPTTTEPDPVLMRSSRRVPLQTVLAAQLVSIGSPDAVPDLEPGAWAVGTAPRGAWAADGATYIEVPRDTWQALLLALVRATRSMPAADLADAQRAVVEWAAHPERTLDWRARPRQSASAPTSAGGSIADQVFEQVVARVRSGGITAGDPVTESSLAKTLRTTRSQTREALRSLAAVGLLDNRGIRGVVVPTPTRADVFDAYAARRALGAEILRRAIANPGLDIARIEAALADVTATASTGDSYATGEADLRFQDVLARCSGMRTIPQMMTTLARQLRIYIAVLGLGYVYPIGEMVADDTELVRCLKTRDSRSALAAWDRKIDATLDFMTAHVTRAR